MTAILHESPKSFKPSPLMMPKKALGELVATDMDDVQGLTPRREIASGLLSGMSAAHRAGLVEPIATVKPSEGRVSVAPEATGVWNEEQLAVFGIERFTVAQVWAPLRADEL